MEFYIILIVVALLIGLSKGGMGQVLGVLVTPLFSLMMPVAAAISLALPLLMIGDVFALWFYWKSWDLHYIRLLVPFAVLGVLVGTYFLATLDNLTLRHVLGTLTLLFVVYKLADYRLRALDYHARDWHGYLTGGVSGIGSALANAGSVPFTAYMLLQDVTPELFIGTSALYFAIVNWLKVPGYLAAGLLDLNKLASVIWAIPLIPLGVLAGRWMIKRINKAGFEAIMLIVLVIASAVLLLIP